MLSGRESSAIKYFEIRLNESNIVLRGNAHEAPGALLKGTLVLCLSEPLKIQGIRLRFTGVKRVGWYNTNNGPNYLKHMEEFSRQVFDFQQRSETLSAGNYEWPFEKIISGDTPESLEGLSETWVIYRLKATIERNILQHDTTTRKIVRIIRTLDPTALELSHEMSVANTWADKVEYSLSTPSKAVMYGSNIEVNFEIIPLLKGLKVGSITTELRQKHNLSIQVSRSNRRSHSYSYAVFTDVYHISEGAQTVSVRGQEGFVFSRSIPIPQSLRKCVQTFDALDVRIRHHLTFRIQLHNPDGHVSEVHASLPIYLYLSPNLPIDDANNLVSGSSQRMNLTASDVADLTPPVYGEHTFDRLYSDIDPNGYITPGGPSGISTPLGSISRHASTENLSSMDAMASSEVTASVLQTRLNTLDAAGPAGAYRPARERSRFSVPNDGVAEHAGSATPMPLPDSFAGSNCSTARTAGSGGQTPSEGISRQPSEEEEGDRGSPQHIEYGAESLTKVPSYSTALQANARTPIKEGLPSYQAAVDSLISSSS